MHRAMIAGLLLALAACGEAVQPPGEPPEAVETGAVDCVQADLTQDAAGAWSVDFTFPAPEAAMFFSRSGPDGGYRLGDWTATSEGVRLEQLGGFDAIVFDAPSASASFAFRPYTGTIRKDYTPFLAFSDGGLALFTGQFELLPAESAEAIEALDGSLDAWTGKQSPLCVSVTSPNPMILDGELVEGVARDETMGGGSYIYVGDGEIATGESFIGVIDTGLPDWLKERFDGDLVETFDALEARWGFPLPQKATLMFAFSGYQRDGYSFSGGVLDNMLALEVGGSRLKSPDSWILNHVRWFFAHEAVHLFQTARGVRLSGGGDSWVHEGGANAMANGIVRDLTGSDEYLIDTYGKSIDDCARYLGDGSLATAGTRGQFDAFYVCGDLISVMTDAALPDYDLYGFWNAMLDKAKAAGGEYNAALYFQTMLDLGAAEADVEALRALVETEVAEPADRLFDLMTRFGLAPEFDRDGKLVSITMPE